MMMMMYSRMFSPQKVDPRMFAKRKDTTGITAWFFQEFIIKKRLRCRRRNFGSKNAKIKPVQPVEYYMIWFQKDVSRRVGSVSMFWWMTPANYDRTYDLNFFSNNNRILLLWQKSELNLGLIYYKYWLIYYRYWCLLTIKLDCPLRNSWPCLCLILHVLITKFGKYFGLMSGQCLCII